MTFEVVIVIFFWIALFPTIHFKPDETYRIVTIYTDHTVPLGLLAIELFQNRIHFSFRHLPITLIIMTFYGLVNITVTFVRGYPVYAPLTFDSLKSWGMAMVLPVLLTIIHTGFVFFSRWRTRRYNSIDSRTGDREELNKKMEDNSSILIDDESKFYKENYNPINLSNNQLSSSIEYS